MQGIQLSLYQWDFISPFKIFVGARNYVRMFSDRTFWQIMRNTFVFTFSTVSLTVLCAFWASAVVVVTATRTGN
jgi:ABC-type sugar transport system permease subunit